MLVPSQISRWYDDQYLRTCRSNGLLVVSGILRKAVVGCGPTGCGRLARVDVADNDHVDVRLFFTVREGVC